MMQFSNRRGASSKFYNWVALLCMASIYVVLFGSFDSAKDAVVSRKNRAVSGYEEADLKYIRDNHLTPYKPDQPTNYFGSRPNWALHQLKNWKMTMSKMVVKRLGHKENGFFVECGALDGVFISNSLLLERSYDWTGLLVEADPALVAIAKSRNRHAWVADVCLSPEPHPMKIEMYGHVEAVGHGFIPNNVIDKERLTKDKEIYSRKFQVQCYPLDMLMAAINQTEIDYFSLDVEGVELDILKTIPYDRIHIKLISVEVRPGNKKPIQDFLQSKGYKRVFELTDLGTEMMHDDLYELQT